jgi:hypothetical protein
MNVPRMPRVMLLTCAWTALGGAARADDAVLLPEASLRLAALRYASDEAQFKWSGWIGGGLTLVRAAGTGLRVDADVETIIGGQQRTFDANQANYQLEVSLRREFGATEVQAVFHHVSRHLEDRPKTQAVDWNLLGLRVARRFGGAWPARVEIGFGRTTQVSLVGYRWELSGRARAERALGAAQAGTSGYGDLRLRFMQAEATPAFPRDGFVDAHLEAGLRLRRDTRHAALFLAFERRNDVFLLEPGARSRMIVGLRLGQGE